MIDNSTSFPKKIVRALQALNRIVPMPNNTTEIELKFFLPEFYENMIPETCKFSTLHQIYLDRPDRPGIECRVRAKEDNRIFSYFYTEKTPTNEDGVRAEHEEQINKIRFEELCTLYRNPAWNDIHKKRYKIPFEDNLLELDVYSCKLTGLVVCECEFTSVEEMKVFRMPEYLGRAIDVTADRSFSNAKLAKQGMPQEAIDLL